MDYALKAAANELYGSWSRLNDFDQRRRDTSSDNHTNYMNNLCFDHDAFMLKDGDFAETIKETNPLWFLTQIKAPNQPEIPSLAQLDNGSTDTIDTENNFMRYLLDFFFILKPLKIELPIGLPLKWEVEENLAKSLGAICQHISSIKGFFQSIDGTNTLLKWLKGFVSTPVLNKLYEDPSKSYCSNDDELPSVIADDKESRRILAEELLDCRPDEITPAQYSLSL